MTRQVTGGRASARRRALIAAVAIAAGGAIGTPAQDEAPAAASNAAPAAAPTDVGIDWKSFHPAAFRRALAEDRLILLVLDVPWSEAVARAEREVWSAPEVVEAVREGFVAIREQADLRPDLRRRYPAEGWPGISILLPDGTPLVYQAPGEEGGRRVTSGFVPAANLVTLLEQARAYASGARAAAIAASRDLAKTMVETSRPESGSISEPMVWSIVKALENTFDAERRYFGGPPRIPRFDLIELMLSVSGEKESPYRTIGLAALETVTKNLLDESDGGLYRMALGLDWEDPQTEKLLDRNARYVDLMTLSYRMTGQRRYRDRAVATARFITDRLSADGGAFASAVCGSCPGGRDEAIISGPNAVAAAALIRAGAVLGEDALLARGLEAARFLRRARYRPGRMVPHAVVDGAAVPPGNFVLDDQVAVAAAFVAAFEATGDPAWRTAAADLATTALVNLRDRGVTALADVLPQREAPFPLRFGLFPQDTNAEMVRVLVRLFYLTDDRRFRDAARDLLRAFAESYPRSALQLPAYGLAAYEYHFPPMTAQIVAPATAGNADALRHASMRSPFPFVVVRTWLPEQEAEAIRALGFTIAADAGLYVFQAGMGTTRQSNAAGVPAIMNDLRARVVARDAPAEEPTAAKEEEERKRPRLIRGDDR